MGFALSCSSGRQLLTAAATGNVEEFSRVLQVRPELVTYSSFWKRNNCLHYAAAARNLPLLRAAASIIQCLPGTSRGGIFKRCTSACSCDVVNQPNQQAQTPLMVACMSGCPGCVGLLLELGSDVLQRGGPNHWNALHYAAAFGRLDVLHLLLGSAGTTRTISGPRAAAQVIIRGQDSVYRYIDSPSADGMTPLHLAALASSSACVRALTHTGASLTARSSALVVSDAGVLPAGSTPLHIAAQYDDRAIVQILLQAQLARVRMRGLSLTISSPPTGSRQDGQNRTDPRTITNRLDQLPYHLAWHHCPQETQRALNPHLPIDTASELADGWQEGTAVRKQLLQWLEGFNPQKCRAIALERAAGLWKSNGPACQEQPLRFGSQVNEVQDGSHANSHGVVSASHLQQAQAEATIHAQDGVCSVTGLSQRAAGTMLQSSYGMQPPQCEKESKQSANASESHIYQEDDCRICYSSGCKPSGNSVGCSQLAFNTLLSTRGLQANNQTARWIPAQGQRQAIYHLMHPADE
ncbi:hypothetical protein WJX84_003286 [Apatococcus fuscideae]|uniref:Uncharacterized protein n=1 Tax=Apatococcus fuscideae TaxID=2026836 RepID=A0AAW1SNP1_9CHLO